MALQGIIQGGKTYTVIGRLRNRIQIVLPVLKQDASGGVDLRKNIVLLTTWATIEALTAQEKFAAHEFTSQVSHKVIIRDPRSALPIDPGGVRRYSITANMQVWWNRRQFQIEGVLSPDGRKDLLELICIEIDDSQNQETNSPSEKSI